MNDEMYIKLKHEIKIDNLEQTSINYGQMGRQDLDNLDKKRKILKSIPLMKALMVLGIKKYTWKNELKLHFGIFAKDIDRFKTLMTDMGYIAHKLIWEIPDDIAYFTMKSMANIGDQAQIMALTPDGEEWAKEAMQYIAKESNRNQSIRLALEYVLQRTKDFKKKYAEVQKLEMSQTTRNIIHQLPRGQTITEERRTVLGKLIDKQTKIGLAENKLLNSSEQDQIKLLDKAGIDKTLLLEHSQANQKKSLILASQGEIQLTQDQALLILGEESKLEKLQRTGANIIYKGQYEYLTASELEKMSEEVITDKDVKEMQKTGHIGAIDSKAQKLDRDINRKWDGLKIRGFHGEEDFETEEYIGKPDVPENKDIFDMLGIEE